VKTTGLCHPGAKQMSFLTPIGYAGKPGSCRIGSGVVAVKAEVILPLWRHRPPGDAQVPLLWDTLFADIKRHEDRHVEIAKNHARELEDALKATGSFADCEQAAAKAKEMTVRMLARHEKAQVRFDRVERINFESRILRLLKYRLETIESRRSRG